MPKISVLMAVHNGLPYLRDAVESILNQSFGDFEFIIVDDASFDPTDQVLKSFRDPRLRLVSNKKQIGLSRSLNKAWDLAEGKYIARMDHDDISLPDRFRDQQKYLDIHHEVDVLGTWARTIGTRVEQTWRYPEFDEDLRCEMLFNSSLVHSSTMLRRETFDKFGFRYDPDTLRAQDYELWSRVSPRVRFANLPKVLLHYRLHSDQVGEQYGDQQQVIAEKIRERELRLLGVKCSKEELRAHHAISNWTFPRSQDGNREVKVWLMKLYSANEISGRFSEKAILKSLEKRWWASCVSLVRLGFEAWRTYQGSPLAQRTHRGPLDKAKFWVKCLLRETGWRR